MSEKQQPVGSLLLITLLAVALVGVPGTSAHHHSGHSGGKGGGGGAGGGNPDPPGGSATLAPTLTVSTSENPRCDEACLEKEAAGVPASKAAAEAGLDGSVALFAQAQQEVWSRTAEALATQEFTFAVPRDHLAIEITFQMVVVAGKNAPDYPETEALDPRCAARYYAPYHFDIDPGCLRSGDAASTSHTSQNTTWTWRVEPAGGNTVGARDYTYTFHYGARATDELRFDDWGPVECFFCPGGEIRMAEFSLDPDDPQEPPRWAALKGTVHAEATYFW